MAPVLFALQSVHARNSGVARSAPAAAVSDRKALALRIRHLLLSTFHARVAEAGAAFAVVVGSAVTAQGVHVQALALAVVIFLFVLPQARVSVAREVAGTLIVVVAKAALAFVGGGQSGHERDEGKERKGLRGLHVKCVQRFLLTRVLVG